MIVALTVNQNDDKFLEKCHKHGIYHYIEKPIDHKQLQAILQKVGLVPPGSNSNRQKISKSPLK